MGKLPGLGWWISGDAKYLAQHSTRLARYTVQQAS